MRWLIYGNAIAALLNTGETMKLRPLLFGGLAIVTCLATIYTAQSWLSSQRQAVAAQTKPEKKVTLVLVAAKVLPTGSFVRAEDLRWQEWPSESANDSYLYKDKAANAVQEEVGAVVRQRIAAGEPVTPGMLMKPGDRGFLAAVLEPGMRAISVSVTATSGVAGLVFPGDRVDLILSHQVKDELDPSGPPKTASETVLTDIRVLAIDQTVTDQDNKPVLAKTVTFEVTPKQVEVIGVASSLGSLSLSLRSIARGTDEPTRTRRSGPVSHTWDTEVSAAIVHNDKVPQPGPVITVLRGSFPGGQGTQAIAQRGPGLLGAVGAGS